MLQCKRMQNVIKICHEISELLAFLLEDIDNLNEARQNLVNILHTSGWTILK